MCQGKVDASFQARYFSEQPNAWATLWCVQSRERLRKSIEEEKKSEQIEKVPRKNTIEQIFGADDDIFVGPLCHACIQTDKQAEANST